MPFYPCPRERSGHAGSVKRLRYEPIYAWASAVESKAPQSAHFRRGLKPSRRWVFLLDRAHRVSNEPIRVAVEKTIPVHGATP